THRATHSNDRSLPHTYYYYRSWRVTPDRIETDPTDYHLPHRYAGACQKRGQLVLQLGRPEPVAVREGHRHRRYRSERTESRACHRFTGDQNDRDPASTGESAERQPRRL